MLRLQKRLKRVRFHFHTIINSHSFSFLFVSKNKILNFWNITWVMISLKIAFFELKKQFSDQKQRYFARWSFSIIFVRFWSVCFIFGYFWSKKIRADLIHKIFSKFELFGFFRNQDLIPTIQIWFSSFTEFANEFHNFLTKIQLLMAWDYGSRNGGYRGMAQKVIEGDAIKWRHIHEILRWLTLKLAQIGGSWIPATLFLNFGPIRPSVDPCISF